MFDECDVSLDCLKCPLSLCKHDDRKPYLAWKQKQGNSWQMEIDRRLLTTTIGTNKIVEKLAKKFKVSERTIFRHLANIRRGEGYASVAGEQRRQNSALNLVPNEVV